MSDTGFATCGPLNTYNVGDPCDDYLNDLSKAPSTIRLQCGVSNCKPPSPPFPFAYKVTREKNTLQQTLTSNYQYNTDVRSYGFYGGKTTDKSSQWNYTETATTLPAPWLNISAFYIDSSSGFYGSEKFGNWTNMAYTYDNKTYDVRSLQKKNGLGVCQPRGVSVPSSL